MNDKQIMISLIVPIFNGQNFIESLVSVLNSITYRKIEVLFVDNNSTDNSVGELKKHLSNSSFQYQILQEKKQGAGYARNTAIDVAKGEYLAFLDCDDKIEPVKFEIDIALFQEHDVDFVFCRTIRNYEDGRVLKHPINGFIEGINEAPSLGLLWLNNFFYLQGPGAIVVKKDVVKQLGCFHTSKTGEDAFLFIRLGLLYRGYFYNREYFYYYRHINSTVSKINSENKTLMSYHNLRKDLFNDPIVLNNKVAKQLLIKQLQIDITKLNKAGYKISELMKDEKLSELRLDYLLFNPFSLLINRLVSKSYYNPFFRLWNKRK